MNDLINRQDAIDAVERAKTARSADGEIFCAKINAQMNIQHLPSAEPKIVRCKDCKYFEPDLMPIPYFEGDGVCCHEHWKLEDVGFEVRKIDFCSYGERKKNVD